MSSKNIAYVREKRIAALLNDMVVHLLASQPTDAMGSLVGYLERRLDSDAAAAAAAKPVESSKPAAAAAPAEEEAKPITPAPPSAKKDKESRPTVGQKGSNDDAAAEKPADDVAKTAVAADAGKGDQPKPAPQTSQTSAGGKDETAAVEAATVAEGADVQDVLKELLASEAQLAELLTAVMSDPAISAGDKAAASEARAHCDELLKYTEYSHENSVQVDLALERVASAIPRDEFFAAKGFRLLQQIDTNERTVRNAFRSMGVDLSALNPDEAALAAKAIAAHEEMLALIDTVEARQVEVSVYANRGAISSSAKAYFDDLSGNIGHTYSELKRNMASIEGRLPEGVAKPAPRSQDTMTLTQQADALLENIRAEQAAFERGIAAILSGDDKDVKAAVEEALKRSDELQRVAATAAMNNAQADEGIPASYGETRDKLNQLSANIATKLLLFNKSHAAAISRVASAVATRSTEETAAITAALKSTLAGREEDEAKEALRAQQELEKLVGDVAATQQAIRMHTASA